MTATIVAPAASQSSPIYAVKTTGIYCRRGCPSRRPRPENVELFSSAAEAERRGYRPCKRCKPNLPVPNEPPAAIVQACRLLDADPRQSLSQLAAAVGLSQFHFHRQFKAALGVTPKAYATAKKADRVRASLTNGQSVIRAVAAADLSNKHRAAAKALGMTADQFRRGGDRLTLWHAVAPCSLGLVLVAATERGVCLIELHDRIDDPESLVRLRFRKAIIAESDRNFARYLAQVIKLIDKPGKKCSLPLDIRGTAFQRRVWEALQQIPPGATATYSDVAAMIGAPKAVRAVAAACAANPLCIVVPCHRVIAKDNTLRGYRWGLTRKQALLDREKP